MLFLLNKAVEMESCFVEDMKDIFGDDIVAHANVGIVGDNGFNGCALRRVFIQWINNLILKCP